MNGLFDFAHPFVKKSRHEEISTAFQKLCPSCRRNSLNSLPEGREGLPESACFFEQNGGSEKILRQLCLQAGFQIITYGLLQMAPSFVDFRARLNLRAPH